MIALHIISGLGEGGAEAVLFRLCKFNTEVQHKVISLGGEGKFGPKLRDVGVKVECLNMPRGKLTFLGLWKLFHLIRKSDAEVVQTWMYHADLIGGVFARLAGIRNVVWGVRHTSLDKNYSSRSSLISAKISAIISGFVPRKIICCAEEAIRVHAEIGYDKDKMCVIANGFELDRFKPDLKLRETTRKSLGFDDRIFLLGMVARFNPQKDHENLLNALFHLSQNGIVYHCVLVGVGVDESNSYLVSLINRLGLRSFVTLLGPRDDIPALMNALDVHILSSSFGEAFPNVIAEAMACATPCVATDVGDASLIIGETGVLVPRNNPKALAKGIRDLLVDVGALSLQERSYLARERVVTNFSLEKMIQEYNVAWFS